MNALFTADFDEEGAGLPNVVEELAMFEHAGVGLAREEGYRLFLAMAQLKQAHGLASIRLFGKVLGTTSDYYVVEGKHATPPTPTPPSKNPSEPELPGAGLNECVYFVASGAAGAFEQLPDVLPEQVAASFRIKKLFTGNLDAPVARAPTLNSNPSPNPYLIRTLNLTRTRHPHPRPRPRPHPHPYSHPTPTPTPTLTPYANQVACYPPFPGKEREYLRTQIARIAQAAKPYP